MPTVVTGAPSRGQEAPHPLRTQRHGAVPTKWNPSAEGLVKLGSMHTNGLGAYTTPYIQAPETLTLVVRYPGDDWYYDAYTSTQKITVR